MASRFLIARFIRKLPISWEKEQARTCVVHKSWPAKSPVSDRLLRRRDPDTYGVGSDRNSASPALKTRL